MKSILVAGAAFLLILGGASCNIFGTIPQQQVTLKFMAQVGDEVAKCGQTYAGLGTTGASAEIVDLRLYVSNIRLINEAGDEVPLTLDQDGKWQVNDVALLDFEDGCGDSGTDDTNMVVTGTAPEGAYVGVSFDVGVPFDLNHDDLAAAPSPLNVSAMFWSWAVGHKFVRVDLRMGAGMFWSMHLGSTLCESGGAASAPVSECAHPNRPTLTFQSMDLGVDTIVFDIKELFADSDLTQDTPDSSAGCQSFSDDVNECPAVFQKLGLDFATGLCKDGCESHAAFRVESGIARGQTAFARVRATTGGQMLACTNCHGATGAGDIGPDIRSSSADHVLEHPNGPGPHPAGVKFPDLTAAEAADIAAYLNSLCAADPACQPFDGHEEHDHGG